MFKPLKVEKTNVKKVTLFLGALFLCSTPSFSLSYLNKKKLNYLNSIEISYV